MLSRRTSARNPMLIARSMLALIAVLGAGCAPTIITAKFPEVSPPPAVKPDATKVGLAPVADSRRDESAGWIISGPPIVAGPELATYIQHKFRNHLAEDGFAPVDAPDPPNNTNPAPYKTVLVTLQSTNFGNTATSSEVASTDIAVQVFAPGNRAMCSRAATRGSIARMGTPGLSSPPRQIRLSTRRLAIGLCSRL